MNDICVKNIISRLPKVLVYEILLYIIEYDPDNIIFKNIPADDIYRYNCYTYSVNGYSDTYDTGYYHYIIKNTVYDKEINRTIKDTYKNDIRYITTLSLSRISKKNNKHRYYITKKRIIIEYDYSHRDFDCGPDKEEDICYSSVYVGKDIYYALLYLI